MTEACVLYARKSDEQDSVADDEKSVPTQLRLCREYAEKKGWAIVGEFADDAVKGKEFSELRRKGLARLMNAARDAKKKKHPPFQAVVTRDVDRIGRDQYAVVMIQELADAGIAVWEYVRDQEIKMDGAVPRFVLHAKVFAGEMESEQASVRVLDKFMDKVKKGHCVGGNLYGYKRTKVYVGEKYSHTVFEKNPDEAEVVIRIFNMAAGTADAEPMGLGKIATRLNDDGVKSPGGKTWAKPTVRQILYREEYRGLVVWGETERKFRTNANGQRTEVKVRRDKPLEVIPRPDLQIIDDDLWARARARLDVTRGAYLRGAAGRLDGRSELQAKFLLAGLARCAHCGGSICVKKSKSLSYYKCTWHSTRGKTACPVGKGLNVIDTDKSVLAGFAKEVLSADALNRTLDAEAAKDDPAELEAKRTRATMDLADAEAEITKGIGYVMRGKYTEAEMDPVLKDARERKAQAQNRLSELDTRARAASMGREAAALGITDWREKLSQSPQVARMILKRLLVGRITLDLEGGGYRAVATFGPFFGFTQDHVEGFKRGTDGSEYRSYPMGAQLLAGGSDDGGAKGLLQASDTSPQESVAPAKPALEADHQTVGGRVTQVVPGRRHRAEAA